MAAEACTRDDDLVERVRMATDLVELVNEELQRQGMAPLSKSDASGNMRSQCPLPDGHNDRANPTSFCVNAEKNGGVWHCWSCGRGGDCFGFVKEVSKVGFPQALHELAGRAGLCEEQSPRSAPSAADSVERLASIRGWSLNAMRNLGAEAKGGRVVFPMRNAEGDVVGCKERMGDNTKVHVENGHDTKSKTRAGSSMGLFYPLDLHDLPDPVLVVEGEADAVAALSAGQMAVVGTAGASPSRDSVRWLQELLRGREVVLAPDPDAAGRQWRDQLTRALLDAGCRARLLVPDGSNDLDDRLRAVDDPAADLIRLIETAAPYVPRGDVDDGRLASFYGQDERLVFPRLAEHLHNQGPVFNLSGRLYRYVDGVYRDSGEQLVRADLAELLGERYTRRGRSEVISYLMDRHQLIGQAGESAADLQDPDLHILNVRNGLLDVRDLSLHPHDPQYISTLQVPHEFDSDAECPAIDRFLHEIFPEDAVQLAYEFAGSLLRRDLNPERALLLLGEGENGKSLFIQLLHKLVGAANCSAVTLQEIDESRFHAINLMGKLANFCADLPESPLRDTSTFKRAVSRDPIEGERKHEQPLTFTPFCKFVFSCNKIPATLDHSHAFYRRWLPVEFPYTFVDPDKCNKSAPAHHRPGRPRDELTAQLTTPSELRGFLARALSAVQEVAERGGRYSEPVSVQQAAQRFRCATDSVVCFADDCLARVDGATVSRQEVYKTYRSWARQQGLHPESQAAFNARLKSWGANETRPRVGEKRVHSWLDLTLDQGSESRGAVCRDGKAQ
jgi:P4 family phage/plasmid primase-like protien